MARSAIDHIVRLRELPSVQANATPQPQNLFVYCSTPRPVLDTEVSGGHYGRPLYQNNVLKPAGVHSYYNISWDPRVRRGDPLQTRQRREQLECEKIRRKLTEPRKKTAKELLKGQKKQARVSDPQAMIRAANMRYARLAISNLHPKEKDAFLVELTGELDQDEICFKGQRIGAARILPKVPSRKKNLVDVACQIWPEDFFNFDTQVVPVLERLVGAVCYQARMEVLEEEELKALKLERELFEEQKRNEELELFKYKTRVERHLAEEERQAALARQQTRDEAFGKIGVSLFAGVFVKYSMEEALQALGDEYLLIEKINHAIQTDLKSWINKRVGRKMKQYYLSRRLLDELIRVALNEKEAETAADIWKDMFSEEPMRGYSEDSNLVPPPTPGTSIYTSDEEDRGFLTTSNYFAGEGEYDDE